MSLLILSDFIYNNITTGRIRKYGGILIITAVCLLTLSACGLPSYAYLYPPTDVKVRYNPDEDPDRDLIFRNAHENDPGIFSGYEVYYKIYDPLDIDTSATQYITDRDTISTSVGAGDSILESRNFTRLYFTNSNDATFIHNSNEPAFALEPALLDENFFIRLLFSQNQSPGSSYIAETYDSSFTFSDTYSYYLYRYVSNDSLNTVEKKFFDSDDFDINDSDMPSTIDSASFDASNSGGYYLYISFYILSFGKDPADLTKLIYSVPVYLGTLKFECNLTNLP